MKLFSEALREFARDWRAGELRLLVAAVVLSVAALCSVGFFAERMRLGLSTQAQQLIGGDLVLNADNPVPQAVIDKATALGLKSAKIVSFPSMVQHASRADALPQLSSVKAVQSLYPLRGKLRLRTSERSDDEGVLVSGAPAMGSFWADGNLAQALGLRLGDKITLGESQLSLAGFILLEPDRGTNFLSLAPRTMINLEDLAATKLVQAGSRVGYRVQFAGEADAVKRLQSGLQLDTGQRFESLEGGRPELRTTLDRAQKFLSLVSLLTTLIAACAIAMGAQRYAARHIDAFAIQRAIGANQYRLAARTVLELFLVAAVGSLVGVVIGYAAHLLLVAIASSFVQVELPAATAWPALTAWMSGLVLLLAFSSMPMLSIAKVSPLKVLRRDLGAPSVSVWVSALLGLAATAALLFWQAQDVKLASAMFVGILASVFVFVLLSWLALRGVLWLVGSMGSREWLGWKLGHSLGLLAVAVASWRKRQLSTVMQTTALAVAMLALVLLSVTRNDLLSSWKAATPADAPNRFFVNIQPDQKDPIEKLLLSQIKGGAQLYPMVRGRLVSVNGNAVGPQQAMQAGQGDRAARLLDREFNLSYMDNQPTHNKTIRGRWVSPGSNEVSVEEGIAQTLGLKLGDRLKFTVAAESFEVTVVGIRKLAWDSLKVNFFMITSTAALKDKPQTWVTSVHLPLDKELLVAQLVREFPNLTVFDAGAILRQVRSVVDQVSRAVEFLFLFTLAAGVMVLYASQAASRDERLQQAALLRALGASSQQLVWAQRWELAFLGALAGALAAFAALAIGAVLALQIFEFALKPNWWAIPLAMLAASACALFAGWMGLRGVLKAPPLQTLRQANQ